jgi:Na+/H+ antiporter NhaA
MIVPAGIISMLNYGTDAQAGIPMATDIDLPWCFIL